MGKTKTSRTDLLPGTLDMLILRTLSQGEMHGYGVAEHIRQTSDDSLLVEEGSLYPALQRLELRGWVASSWGRSANNRKARFYRLTPAGRRQLEREIAGFQGLIRGISRVLGTT